MDCLHPNFFVRILSKITTGPDNKEVRVQTINKRK
jgi:hypothetical protein